MAAPPPKIDGLRLATLSFNLRFGLARDGANKWSLRRKAVGDLLAAYPADFMVFQEVNAFQAHALAGDLPNHGCIGLRRPAPEFWQNNLIFYHHRWRCLRHRHFFLRPTPGIPSRFRESRWPRQCTLGVFTCRSHEIVCVNTHLDFKSSVQVAGARMIRKAVDREGPGLPALLMGDFNTGPDSPCRQALTGPARSNGRCRFRSVFTAPYPGTHHGFTGTATGDQIDWILYSGRLKPTGCRIIRDTFDGRYPSDHFPVYAEFELPVR